MNISLRLFTILHFFNWDWDLKDFFFTVILKSEFFSASDD